MEQIVRVTKTHDNGMATVLLVRESACSGDCHKCSGCGAAKEYMIFDAVNAIGASKGDLVVIQSKTGPVMKAVGVFYVMPMILFFLGYYLGAFLNAGGLAGGLGFALGIAIAVVYFMAMYDIYTSCNPQNNVLFLVLSIVFTVTEPFFVFFLRKKDEGMPPRRSAPQQHAYVPPQSDMPRYDDAPEIWENIENE